MSASAGEIRPFYHLAFIAREEGEGAEAVGALGAVVADVQGRAGGEEVPIWVTVSSARWKAVMESFGFRVVDEVVVGEGRVDERGWPSSDRAAVGVRVWALMWEA